MGWRFAAGLPLQLYAAICYMLYAAICVLTVLLVLVLAVSEVRAREGGCGGWAAAAVRNCRTPGQRAGQHLGAHSGLQQRRDRAGQLKRG
jgi:hypothetical protein